MLTQCPDCGAVFKVRAEHLASAAGFVECGACGAQFDALRRLADEPAPPPEPPPEPAPPPADRAGPTFRLLEHDDDHIDLPDGGQPRPPDPVASAGVDAANEAGYSPAAVEDGAAVDIDLLLEAPDETADDLESPVASAIAVPRDAPAVSGTTLPPEEHAILFTDPNDSGPADDADLDDFDYLAEAHVDDTVPERRLDAGGDAAADDDFDLELDPDDVPEVIRREYLALHQRRSRLRYVWPALVLLLIVALAAQAGWYFRTELRAGLPALEPVYTALCGQIDCSRPLPGDSAGIELVGRDVREHPRYLDALLVNATLSNRGDATAPFPQIELGLYDSGGGAVGVRRFDPGEYLDQSIDLAAGLPPGRSVYVILEIAGAAERAVSFEFTLL